MSQLLLNTLTECVIASQNLHKVIEFKALLPEHLVLHSAASWYKDEPEETGSDFISNARIKARYAVQKTGLAALSDDSGLCIDALGGRPGIYSSRLAGKNKDFLLAMTMLERELHDSLVEKPWSAYFVAALVLVLPDGREYAVEAHLNGTIQFPPSGENGFGYDPIFYPNHAKKSLALYSFDEKQEISHRYQAVQLLRQKDIRYPDIQVLIR
jgi:XTP/dITP diphosphohydrolase